MTALIAQPLEDIVFETESSCSPSSAQRPHLRLVGKAAPANTSMHSVSFKIFALINAAILGAFWLTFLGDAGALFMIAISGVYLMAYLATPYVINRVGPIDPPQHKMFDKFLREPFATWTGIISGREALLQMILIPSAILIAVIGMGLVIAGVQ